MSTTIAQLIQSLYSDPECIPQMQAAQEYLHAEINTLKKRIVFLTQHKESVLVPPPSVRDLVKDSPAYIQEWHDTLNTAQRDELVQEIQEDLYQKLLAQTEQTLADHRAQLKKVSHALITLTTTKLYPHKALTQKDLTPLKQVPISQLMPYAPTYTSSTRDKYICPLHNEKTASFTVYHNMGGASVGDTFHCFGCQESGDTISLVQKLNNLTFQEALTYLERYV